MLEEIKQAPPSATFVRPAWGLTHAIPDGATLAWGARAIYAWRLQREPVLTATGRQKMSRGRPVTRDVYRPAIDLLFDRMGWSNIEGIDKAEIVTMGRWIDDVGLVRLRELCHARSIETTDDGERGRIDFASNGYAIAANPNGSCGYLYIAAWKVPQ